MQLHSEHVTGMSNSANANINVAIEMLVPASIFAYCGKFVKSFKSKWGSIGCVNRWSGLPFICMKFKDPELEFQYQRLCKEDTQETLKTAGVIFSLAWIVYAVVLWFETRAHGMGDVWWRRMTVPLIVAVAIITYALLHKMLVRWGV
ncbi:unnamed protein product [Vitrella brassicaformis CCMP3155]|uniref:Uncharacterized protein n=1 Tax=Vitrella brassicaformis (strain CCMP3155) TaxID=1169540 RepID=A0A0G4EVJ0_VITBC|nr:unnamed protein product [Vitrella brassicaformis CCMP3155]|eukprot:CEM02432.1 unnamed protein product [Vitrella brassicaformis CCMP3155]